MSRCKHGMLKGTCAICSSDIVRYVYDVSEESNPKYTKQKETVGFRRFMNIFIKTYGEITEKNMYIFLSAFKSLYKHNFHDSDYYTLPKYRDEYVGKIGYGTLWNAKENKETKIGAYNTLSKMGLEA